MNKTISRTILCIAASLPLAPIGSIHSAAEVPNQTVVVSGMVSCRQCRKGHAAKGWPNSSCTLRCVREGSDFVLVVGKQMYGNKIYKLDGDRKVFEKLAGGKATFLGHFDDSGNAFFVDRVEAAK